ncbi:MAG: VCBS repeat-containing protein [Acidobacteria bacterium]|nr:VCBS repeat-containing protein [Acidobacteriota bacterium]
MRRRRGTWAVLAAALSTMTVAAQQNYVYDTRYAATSLAGWHVLGDAAWRAEKGEYVGTPKSPAGGWLMLDRALQDVGVFGRFRCTGGCKTGVLLRAEKTADGMKGIYVALAGEDAGAYAVTLDAAGKELSRSRLRTAGGQIRFAPPAPPTPPAPTAPRAGGAGRASAPPNLPLTPPVGGLRAEDWNLVEIVLDASIIRPFLNESSIGSAAAEDAVGAFGPVALYVGGTGEVRYKDVATSDLALKTLPLERVSANFRMQQLHEFYYSWGGAVGDFNRDGANDVAAGPYYHLGPDFTKFREIYLAQTVNPSTEYPNDCMQNFADDVTGDGWTDVFCMGAIGQDLHLYVNPQNQARRWTKIDVVPQVQKEVSLYKDIDGDGKGEFIYGGGGFLRYAEPDPANPLGKWIVHDISTQGPWGAGHGLGVGDISGDGKVDVVDPYGWWEQPAGGAASGVWTYHPEAFGKWTGHASPGGGEIGVYDVNGDKRADVVAVLQAHGWGLNWYEQKRDAAGKISFVPHVVMGDLSTKNAGDVAISEMHGSTVADVDGDKIEDFIVGKRFWSHRDDYTDPDPYGPPVIYVYRTVRDAKAPGGARLVPELVHNRSGAGNAVTAADVNKDGLTDLVSSTDRGLFVFFGKPRGTAAATQKP